MGKNSHSVHKVISNDLRKKPKKKSRRKHSSKSGISRNLAPVCGLFVFVGLVAYRNYLLSLNSSEAIMLHHFKRQAPVYIQNAGVQSSAEEINPSNIPAKLRGIYVKKHSDTTEKRAHRTTASRTESRVDELQVEEKTNLLTFRTPVAKDLASMQIKRRYDDRKKLLMEKCSDREQWAWKEEMQLLAVPERNFTVCVVQKAGSTSWHKTVHELRDTGEPFKKSVHLLNRYLAIGLPKHVKDELMASPTATRVIAVRHPFSRLLSGWNNKFHKDFRMKDIFVKMVGSYLGRHTPDEEHVIAFQDFVQFIADNGLEKVDVHFKSIEQLCKPCLFPYDYVVRAETTLDDLWYVLDRVNATMDSFVKHSIEPGEGNESSGQSSPWETEAETIKYFFQHVPRKTIKKLLNLYSDDFEKFGYTFNLDSYMIGDIID